MSEQWRKVPGYPGIEVSDKARIRKVETTTPFTHKGCSRQRSITRRAHVLYQTKKNGYFVSSYSYEGRIYHVLIHRLLALAFVPGYFEGATVDHINHNRTDNRIENLEWVTRSENSKRCHRAGKGSRFGWDNHKTKVAKEDYSKILEMRNSGVPARKVAELFGLSPQYVYTLTCRLRRGKI